VEKFVGSFDNVVGLPVKVVQQLLWREGWELQK
jgi:predicted house-cleaning NTP pyrophosphatase (Maf/HAM1 superfamily)